MQKSTQTRRELKKQETRANLIDKALELFNENGVGDIGMRQLAKESGLGIGTYYNYFKTKDEIIFAIFNKIFSSIFLTNKKVKSEATIEETLDKQIAANLKALDKYKKILFQFVQTIASPEHYRAEDSEGRVNTEQYINIYWDFVQRVFVSHERPVDENDEKLKRMFWHQFMIFLYMWITDPSKNCVQTKSYIEFSNSTLIHGLPKK